MAYLGSSEDPTDVQAKDLEVGTRIDSFRFDGGSDAMVVQEVETRGKTTRVVAANFYTGKTITRYLYNDRLISASGKL